MFDFASITKVSRNYTFHAHTQFCDGRDTMEQMALSAIDHGFTHLGFSPHSPVPFKSPCNMAKENVPAYLDEIGRLQRKFAGKLTIFKSMEIDFSPISGPSDDFYQSLPLDYRIGSVHFISSFVNPNELIDIDGHPDAFIEKMHTYFNDDIEAVVHAFYRQSLSMVESGGFDLIGHLDKIGFNASQFQPGIDEQPWYDALVRQLIEAIMDHHLTIEVNTKAFERDHRLFPAEKYFPLLKHYDAPVVFNSDAHYAARINSGREQAMALYAQA